MSDALRPLTPGAIYPALLARTHSAIACGALHSIATEQRFLEDGGVRFLVRSVSSLRRKAEERLRRTADTAPGAPAANPFLPPEPALTVGALGCDHIAVLNKFNVLERHLLIVTHRFQHQETLLNGPDFAALGRCLGEIDGLGFYNGGTVAGASQPHKHLQLVPLPLVADGPSLPIEPLLAQAPIGEAVQRLPGLPFRHAFCRLPEGLWRTPEAAARWGHERYRALLAQCGIGEVRIAGEPRQSAPYNLLLTRSWMLLVPRAREHFDRISVNALGYAGSLFVRTREDLEQVARTGPLRLLAAVALPASD